MKKVSKIHIRRALSSEASFLSDISFRSKAYWGYDHEFMDQVRAELLITEEAVHKNHIFVAEENGHLLVFYELSGTQPVGKLLSLFIDPIYIGQGIGKLLFKHALFTARDAGVEKICIDSDPYAEGFYKAMGAIRVGEVPSGSIQGRRLPLMEIDLT